MSFFFAFKSHRNKYVPKNVDVIFCIENVTMMQFFLLLFLFNNFYLFFTANYDNEMVAVKRLRSKCSPSDFEHLRTISHPNLVTFRGVASESFWDSNNEENSSYQSCSLVMEYCPFGQLCQHLASIETLPPSLLADWSRQLASGMAYLHSRRIIHRDLKSPNVLISHGQLLKICDFDTSHRLQQVVKNEGDETSLSSVLSRQMSLAGTLAWMAPEMIRNEKCSEKIDIW